MVWASAATFQEFVDLANAIAWPIAVAVSVMFLRKPIANALGRATKITAFQVSLELAAVPEFQTAKEAGSPFALRQPAAVANSQAVLRRYSTRSPIHQPPNTS